MSSLNFRVASCSGVVVRVLLRSKNTRRGFSSCSDRYSDSPSISIVTRTPSGRAVRLTSRIVTGADAFASFAASAAGSTSRASSVAGGGTTGCGGTLSAAAAAAGAGTAGAGAGAAVSSPFRISAARGTSELDGYSFLRCVNSRMAVRLSDACPNRS